jgi:hypothetical protein
MADTTLAAPVGSRDLRKASVQDVLGRVEAGLGMVLDRESLIRKRRSVGARSDRGTWVRVEVRSLVKIAAHGQAGNGMEAANLITGINKPAWYAGLCWHDGGWEAVWRADEVELVTDTPLQRRALHEVSLSQAWWDTLNASLDALGRQQTTRIATPDTELMTQGLVTREIERAFPGQVDTNLTEQWVPAHADLNWANLTWPECWIIDWEDHGLAPRGLDAANLWASSLGTSELAERVWQERWADLETRSGRLMSLFCCAKVLNDPSIPAKLRETVMRPVRGLVGALQR